MSIVGIQRRLHEVGRIRIGEQVAAKKRDGTPTTRPGKLTSFRLTSRNREALETAAKIYGGDVRTWDDAPIDNQFELYTDSSSLNVVFPPSQLGFSQFYELWSGGGCQRRCDGERDTISDCPCMCDPENRDCRPTTRLNVILADLDGIGTWRLESHGYYAASELAGIVDTIDMVRSQGAGASMIPANLILEQRQSKKIDKDGKPQTFNYAVPIMDLKMSVASLVGNLRNAPRLASGVTPLHPDEPPTSSIVDQLHAHDDDEPKTRKSNSAAVLPATGLKPKSATEDFTIGGASKRSVKRLFAVLRGNKDIPTDDDGRHAWAREALGLDKDTEVSFDNLGQQEINRLNKIADGSEPLYAENEEPFK